MGSVTRGGWKLCASRQCTVKLYQHDNFGGWSHTYDQGNFAHVSSHDNMSSMTISPGWTVTLHAGRYTMTELIRLGFQNDRVRSLKVAAGEATIGDEGRRLEVFDKLLAKIEEQKIEEQKEA